MNFKCPFDYCIRIILKCRLVIMSWCFKTITWNLMRGNPVRTFNCLSRMPRFPLWLCAFHWPGHFSPSCKIKIMNLVDIVSNYGQHSVFLISTPNFPLYISLFRIPHDSYYLHLSPSYYSKLVKIRIKICFWFSEINLFFHLIQHAVWVLIICHALC